MANRAAAIAQAEIARAVRAAQAVGLVVSGYEVNHEAKTIRVFIGGAVLPADGGGDIDAMIARVI